MNLNDAYPSKYLKAEDIPEEGSQTVTIERILMEDIGRDKQRKVVIYFEELSKGLICNKTNARLIARVLDTEEFDDWIGRTISLYRTETQFQGDLVDAIRVKAKPEKLAAKPVAVAATPAAKPVTGKVVDDDDDDGIPF